MADVEIVVSPKYKKSFLESTIIQKRRDDKILKVTREVLWRTGEISVTITPEKFEKYCRDNDLKTFKLFSNERYLFETLQDDNSLVFDENFPFEYEFLSSFDGCSDDYTMKYDDGSEVENWIQEEINFIIEEGGFYDLEDDHGFEVVDTKYEIYGEFELTIKI